MNRIAERMAAAALLPLLAAACPAAGQADQEPETWATRLGEKVVIVTDGGMGSQLAVDSRSGIVVFDTGYCTRIAGALRRRIETEFGRADFAAVVLTNQRLDYVGGGGAYPGVPVIAHERARDVLAREQANLRLHLQPLIDMWRRKEDVSRERLPSHEPGSPAARREENWLNTCRRMADDLSGDYALALPTRAFTDRMSLDLGDMTLELEHLGVGARGEAGMVARIPELKLVLFGRLLFHEQHLLPYLNTAPWQDLDIPRTLRVLDGILDDEANVETVIVTSGPWPLAEIRARRRYMGDLWDAARDAAARGATVEQAQQELTVDARFPYLKELPVWERQGAEWCGMEHLANVARFWGQFQRYAAREIFDACRSAGPEAALAKYDECARGAPGDVIVDDESFDSLVESLFHEGFAETSEAVARRNAITFTDSWRAHRRLGETLLARGDEAGALAAFRRVLELDPQNEPARRRIAELEAAG